ncbi:MAG: hypothetical protein BAJALOKI3v1_530013 [Promethearchaeota archaeon]|nr:MAG: hypothetical protein BAJALOKI3v1_530013 [Candidatus Lokiarchaeota archaeon]
MMITLAFFLYLLNYIELFNTYIIEKEKHHLCFLLNRTSFYLFWENKTYLLLIEINY